MRWRRGAGEVRGREKAGGGDGCWVRRGVCSRRFRQRGDSVVTSAAARDAAQLASSAHQLCKGEPRRAVGISVFSCGRLHRFVLPGPTCRLSLVLKEA